MKIPQIQIQTTDIAMNYQITAPQIQIQQGQAELAIEQPAAILEINTTNSQIQTDMTQFYRDLGFKKTSELISEFAQKGSQVVLEQISKRASQGRQLLLGAGKGQGDATIASIIKREHGPEMPPISNIRFIPSYNAIDISFTPSDIEINVQQQPIDIQVKTNKTKIDLTYGDVKGTMIERPSVMIDVIQ